MDLGAASEVEIGGEPPTRPEHHLPQHRAPSERQVFRQALFMKKLEKVRLDRVNLHIGDVSRTRPRRGLAKLVRRKDQIANSRTGTSVSRSRRVAFTNKPQSAT